MAAVAGAPEPVIDHFWWGGEYPNLPVAIGSDGEVYIALSHGSGSNLATSIVGATATGPLVTVPGSRVGGLAATADGFGLLLFDPVEVGQRQWATVVRVRHDAQQVFSTDVFRSSNLDEEGTLGEPASGRLEYLGTVDGLLAYFGHTRRYDDGVRHQGGYVASFSSTGVMQTHGDWFGSHNLDQRSDVDDSGEVLLVGVGDAYPRGIFAEYLSDRVRPMVIHEYSGDSDAQLGDIVNLSDRRVISIIDNFSFWDAMGSDGNPADARLGLLTVPKGGDLGLVSLRELPVLPSSGARMTYLKSVRYGPGDLVLVAWKEQTDSGGFCYTMVVDSEGRVCQPERQLDAEYEFLGDDFAVHPNGSIVWANARGGRVNAVTLVPG